MKSLVALPVYNEAQHVDAVLDEVKLYAEHVVAIDDGSTDGTSDVLRRRKDVVTLGHPVNSGYGAALQTAFAYADQAGYDAVVTIDCDRQHEPKRIPEFVAALDGWDVVSGSRYRQVFEGDSSPPEDRWKINRMITAELNKLLGLQLTDAFCGFKAYRVCALRKLHLTEKGYAMPLEFWVQAVHHRLRIREIAVPLIYLDESRSFGGDLDRAETRLRHYREVIQRSLDAVAAHPKPWCGDDLLFGCSVSPKQT